MKLQLTTKEQGLLKDMKDQEELCVQKYEAYAERAKREELKARSSAVLQKRSGST